MLFRRETVCVAGGYLISGLTAVLARDYASGAAHPPESTALSHSSGVHEFKIAIAAAAPMSAQKPPKIYYHDDTFVISSAFLVYKNELHELSAVELVELKERPFPSVRITVKGAPLIEHRAMVGDAPREIKAALDIALEDLLKGGPPDEPDLKEVPPDLLEADDGAEPDKSEHKSRTEDETGDAALTEYESEPPEAYEPEDAVEPVPQRESAAEIPADAGGKPEPETGRILTTTLDVRAPSGGGGESGAEGRQAETHYYRGRAGFVTNLRYSIEGRTYPISEIYSIYWLGRESKKEGCAGFKPGCIWLFAILLAIFVERMGLFLAIVMLIVYYSIKSSQKKAVDSISIVMKNGKTVSVSDKPAFQGDLRKFFEALERSIAENVG